MNSASSTSAPGHAPQVLFEDPNIIVLAKPPGWLSQGDATGDPSVVDWLRERLGRPYVGLVHRLDRNTSGLMIVAKRTKAARRLTEALTRGEIERTYLAWLEGRLKTQAVWRHWLKKDEKTNRVAVRDEKAARAPGYKEAVLKVEPLRHQRLGGGAACDLTLARFTLETGRSHQIRAQASAMGFPLLGDRKYGSRAVFPRPALHSATLAFPHPITKEIMKFDSGLPPDLQSP